MAENLDNDVPKNNIRFEELKNILKNEKIEEKSHPQQLPLRSNQSSNVQAEENAPRTQEKPVSNPVHSGPKLYVDLYSEILAHVIREQRTLDAVVKFGMIGKEAWIAMTYFFQTVNQLKLSKYVEFRFEAYFDYYSIFCNKYDNLVKELMTIAVPFVKKVIFEMPDKKWYNHFFEILSKDTKQKVLEIYGLTKVDDVAKMALKNLVNNGVLVKFGYVNDYVLEDLPDCHFDSLIFYGWNNHFLSQLQGLTCTFDEINISSFVFSFDAADFLKGLFLVLREFFPKTEKLVLDSSLESFAIRQREDFDQIIEAVENAPQQKIDLFISSNSAFHRNFLPQNFIPMDSEKTTYEWRSETNKTIKIRIERSFFDDFFLDEDHFNFPVYENLYQL